MEDKLLLEDNPQNTTYWNYLGYVHDFDQANHNFQTAVQIEPDNLRFHLNLSKTYHALVYTTKSGVRSDKSVLYRNNRDGTFTDLTELSGTRSTLWSSSATFFDYDLDGYLDLYVVNYVPIDQTKPINHGLNLVTKTIAT